MSALLPSDFLKRMLDLTIMSPIIVTSSIGDFGAMARLC